MRFKTLSNVSNIDLRSENEFKKGSIPSSINIPILTNDQFKKVGIEYKNNFDQIYPDLSKQYNLPLIPFLLEGVALKPDLNLSDGMHPNEKGTIIISKTLQEMILKNILSN